MRDEERRARLLEAEQLLQELGPCLQAIDHERFQTDAAGAMAFLLDWVQREIKKARPN